MVRTFALALVLLSVSWTIGPLAHAQTPATASAYTHDASYAKVSRAAIRRAAREFRVNVDLMLAIAWCESRLDPHATNPNSGAAGLYQFMWPTFTHYSAQLWWAPRTWLSPYNPRAAARTAAYMISLGLAGQWTCSYVVG
jgi:Transglycosylase SLT domain